MKKIVVTGGPGGGKTTALDLFRRELKTIRVVPEAASILFAHGLERQTETEKIKSLQQSIYQMQKNLEDIFTNMFPENLLICDRGSLDGLAYWPEGQADFFARIGSSYEQELNRYEAVIFFQTAAAFGEDVKSNNAFRTEDSKTAIALDQKLKAVWEKHPNFNFIPSNSSFMRKIVHGIITIEEVLENMRGHDMTIPTPF